MNGELSIYQSATYDMGQAFAQAFPTNAKPEAAFRMAKDYYTNIATNNRDRAQVKLAYKRFVAKRKQELSWLNFFTPDALKVLESAPTSPVEAPETEQAMTWLNSWLDEEPAPAPHISELRATFSQMETYAVYVASKHDFSPEGEREFLTAARTAKIAKDNLYYAEAAADRAQPA